MKKFNPRRTAASILVAAAVVMPSLTASVTPLVSTPAVAASTINNPIIWADVPDDDIIRVGDTYYMVSTTMFFSPGAPIMKSKDLANWEICNYVFNTYANGDVQNLTNGKNDYSHGQWATSLRYNEKSGKYYAFFGSYGSNKSYICSTDDIEHGEWSRVELNGMYHDASMLFDDDGRNYLVYGAGGTCNIKEFNSDMTGWAAGATERRLFKTNFDNLAGEGWHIHKINGYYYILGIAWPSGHGRLEFCYRSKSLNGNWENKTLLDSGLGSYGSGCAQGGIVDTPDGKWYGLMFQDHGAVGRIPVLVPVNWQNDWPMMGVNGKAPITLDLGTTQGTDVAGDDSFDYTTNDLALEWSWNHNPDNSAWSVTERPGWLRLKNKNMASHLLNARNTLTMRTEGPACSSYIKLDASNMKAGDYAGLSAFQLKYGCIGVYVTDGGQKKVYMSVNGGNDVGTSSNKIVAEQNMSGDEVYLKVDFKFATVGSDGSSSNNIDKANFYYSFDGMNWTKLGQELSMSYDLKLFTGYRSGIYSYATKTTGGYADIDFFEYDRQTWNGCNGSKVLSGTPVIIEPDENGYYFHNTFESSTESWTGRGSASVAVNKTEAYDGSGSIACTGREASWNGASKALSSSVFKAGQEYSFSTIVKYDEGPATQKFYLTLQYEADGDVQYDKIATVDELPKGEWVQLANTNYKIPEGASNLQMYVETDSDEYSFYVDEAIGGVAGTKIDGPKAVVTTTTTTAPVVTTTTTTAPAQDLKDILNSKVTKWGDANGDGGVDMGDVVLIMQSLANPDKYTLTEPGIYNADVSEAGGGITANDALAIQKFLLGATDKLPESYSDNIKTVSTEATTTKATTTTTTTTTTTATTTTTTAPKSNFNYNANLSYRANDQYLNQCSQAGKIVKESYNGINGNKSLNVYLPYGYDENKQYNIFYLMHGGGENENTIFSNDVKMQNILDNMIKNGELEPMIVVTPTFNGCPSNDGNMGAGTVWNEMRQSIIPFVEGKYSTYAGKDTSIDSLKASRYHRAYGGFSMGGGSTWNMLINNLDICAYYMPLSGHCWGGVEGIQNAIDKSGLSQREYFVLAATGDKDLAYNNMLGLINPLKQDTKHFTYSSDFSKGNFYFLVASSNDGIEKTHWWGYVRWYIYDALPYFFHEGQ